VSYECVLHDNYRALPCWRFSSVQPFLGISRDPARFLKLLHIDGMARPILAPGGLNTCRASSSSNAARGASAWGTVDFVCHPTALYSGLELRASPYSTVLLPCKCARCAKLRQVCPAGLTGGQSIEHASILSRVIECAWGACRNSERATMMQNLRYPERLGELSCSAALDDSKATARASPASPKRS
jgi:hypothetical protein